MIHPAKSASSSDDDLIDRLNRFYSRSSGSSGKVTPSPMTIDFSGRRIGRYIFRRQLGSGSFGKVYLAYDTQLERLVALKVPRYEVLLDTKNFDRFICEAKAAAKLSHPGIVTIHDAGWLESTPFIASAYCPGLTLAEWLTQHPQAADFQVQASVVVRLAEAVQYIHSRGVIHHDLKPANVMMVADVVAGQDHNGDVSESGITVLIDGRPCCPMLTDFGLASLSSNNETHRNRVGTISYMSPEQASGESERIDHRTDVFGLGAIFYHLLTGRPPYCPETIKDLHQAAINAEVVPPIQVNRLVPAVLNAICMKCLARKPEDRYASAAALSEDLKRFSKGEPTEAYPCSRWRRMGQALKRPQILAEAHRVVLFASSIQLVLLVAVLIFNWLLNSLQQTQKESGDSMLLLVGLIPLAAIAVYASYLHSKKKLPNAAYWMLLLGSFTAFGYCLLALLGVAPCGMYFGRMASARMLGLTPFALLLGIHSLALYVADQRRWTDRDNAWWHRSKRSLAVASAIVVVSALLIQPLLTKHPLPIAGPAQFWGFDGDNDVAVIENIPYPEQSPFTIELRARCERPQKASIMTYGPISLMIKPADEGVYFCTNVTDSDDAIYLIDTRKAFPLHQWLHLAVCYDQDQLRLFVNGELQPTKTWLYQWSPDGSDVTETDLPRPLSIVDIYHDPSAYVGANQPQSGTNRIPFKGRIGEIQISKAAFYTNSFSPQMELSPTSKVFCLLHLGAGNQATDEVNQFVIRRYE